MDSSGTAVLLHKQVPRAVLCLIHTTCVKRNRKSSPSSILETTLVPFQYLFLSRQADLGASKLISNSVVSRFFSTSPSREGFSGSLIQSFHRVGLVCFLRPNFQRMLQRLSYLKPNGTNSSNMGNTAVSVQSCPFSKHQNSQRTTDAYT